VDEPVGLEGGRLSGSRGFFALALPGRQRFPRSAIRSDGGAASGPSGYRIHADRGAVDHLEREPFATTRSRSIIQGVSTNTRNPAPSVKAANPRDVETCESTEPSMSTATLFPVSHNDHEVQGLHSVLLDDVCSMLLSFDEDPSGGRDSFACTA